MAVSRDLQATKRWETGWKLLLTDLKKSGKIHPSQEGTPGMLLNKDVPLVQKSNGAAATVDHN